MLQYSQTKAFQFVFLSIEQNGTCVARF